MSHISPKETSQKWGVSERMVSRYCMQGRIENAYQENGVWYIPEDAVKPARKHTARRKKPEKKTQATRSPKLLKMLIHQRDGRQYRGLYEYLQINMVYSSERMASNRLTREQVQALFKTDRISTNGEAIKVCDIIDARNHFQCVDMVLDAALKPLTQTFLLQLQKTLLSETSRHKRHTPLPLGYRNTPAPTKFGKTAAPADISPAVTKLFQAYEKTPTVGLHEILDLHVQFERIRPFEDCNGRLGRLLMLKECLRHGITPFILDDKRRTGYLNGLCQWDELPEILTTTCLEAQNRFKAQIELQKLMACQANRRR